MDLWPDRFLVQQEHGSKLRTGQDVLEDDLYVVVAVGARVFVPEADHVTELVHHDAELVAVLADRDRLRPVAALSHERTAPAP